jgi:hypothetical protein
LEGGSARRRGYVYIKKLRRQQAQVIQNHENENVRNIGQGET